ncbi:glycosyl transferase [Irregularibacter muris]|uniref:Glycosyl transferase n=1 Tax=Irregularibacter muris TaxID=1796619 RepID=A0AAE3HIJ1_9FIRM|nr:PssE/Cps14G family polysaccharide biosynthesis glycosyltransferase [Irregularibacter muris]MCR1900084.1 glycosyl transferase [Irregularibacter muris]
MILVTLGTHELPFIRLVKQVEELKINNVVDDEIIVQSGNTPYESKNLNIQPFFSSDEMDRLYDDADIIITHGGTGSIIQGVKKRKRVIATARLKKYNEHNDDHQVEIIDQFVEAGYILDLKEDENIGDKIREAKIFQPKIFISGRDKIIQFINDYIQNI